MSGPGPLERTCWRQFVAQWGDCQKSGMAPLNAIIITIIIIILFSSGDGHFAYQTNTCCGSPFQELKAVAVCYRFLVFFDDGYAQYCWAKELHKVYYQSECEKGCSNKIERSTVWFGVNSLCCRLTLSCTLKTGWNNMITIWYSTGTSTAQPLSAKEEVFW